LITSNTVLPEPRCESAGPGVDVPELVTEPLTFTWADDSSEDRYEIVVFDSYGNKVWEDLAVPKVSGAVNVTHAYGGPTLETGLYYQFRATSYRDSGVNPGPISTTEDLRGVFFVGN
jgi:hypothetical protein